MTEVIYADVLVVLNLYVTYALLSLTGIICRKKRNTLRIFLSSCVAGIYSLSILLPDIAEKVTAVTGIPFGILLCFIAYGFINKKTFLRLCLSFFALSFVFAGIMLFLWLFFAPKGMYFSNGIVYFDISTSKLVILTIICYAFISLCSRYLRSRTPSDTVYDCEIISRGKSYNCHCFLDTGNSLRDPFTGKPVVIVNAEKFEDTVPLFPSDLARSEDTSFRLIPCCSVAGKKLLVSFTADLIHIKGINKDFSYSDVTVAITNEKIFGGRYDGVLPGELFFEKGEDYDEKNQRAVVKI